MKTLTSGFTLMFILMIPLLNAQENSIIWQEDFESDWVVKWHVAIGLWEVGTPTSGPQEAFTGNNCAATVLNGDYIEPADTRLIRHSSFVVPDASENPRLRFWHWFSFSAEDWGEVQVKTEHGDWETISPRFIRRSGEEWNWASVDLTEFSDSLVEVAFYFHSAGDVWSGADVSSGWYIDDVTCITGPYKFNGHEDFESGYGDWYADQGSWEFGVPIAGPEHAFSGSACAGTNLDGVYHEPVDSRLVSPPFNVPIEETNPHLEFWYWFHFSAEDYGEIQLKSEHGEWITVFNRLNQRSGDAWTKGILDLKKYAGSTVQLAFYFHSAGDVWSGADVATGWYLDELNLVTEPYLFNNIEDFEQGLGDWYIDKGIWEIGIPSEGPSNAYSGVYCVGTNIDGNYLEPSKSRLISPPLLIPDESADPSLVFWHWFSFSAEDWGEVQISGADSINWETISPEPVNGVSGTWSPFYVSLKDYANQKVLLALTFHSAGDVWSGADVSTGWYIDDIRIVDNTDLVVYAGPDISAADCSSADIHATVNGGSEPYTFQWLPSTGLSDPTSLNLTANPTDTTVYTLKVTDALGCFRTDRIVINTYCEEAVPDNDILSFSFGVPPQTNEAEIDLASHTVYVKVEDGTDLTNLVATFTLSEGATAQVGGGLQQSGVTANDFTSPIIYVVTAEDGTTSQGWIIKVTQAPPDDEADILSFSIGTTQIGNALIDVENQTISLKVENGTGLSGLVASFTLSPGASAKVNNVQQESGSTPNDFTEAVTYIVTAPDGETTLEWVVEVIEAELIDTDFLTFGFEIPPQTGESVVNPVGHTVELEVEAGTDLSGLVATFTLSPGAVASVNDAEQHSGVTANDFTNPITYTITAEDDVTVQDWIVTVTVAPAAGTFPYREPSVSVFPNPASGDVILEISNPGGQDLELSVYDISGRKVFERIVRVSGKIRWSRGSLPGGIYMVKLRGPRFTGMKRVILTWN